MDSLSDARCDIFLLKHVLGNFNLQVNSCVVITQLNKPQVTGPSDWGGGPAPQPLPQGDADLVLGRVISCFSLERPAYAVRPARLVPSVEGERRVHSGGVCVWLSGTLLRLICSLLWT